MELRAVIIEALEKRYEAQLAEADATLKIYLENSVGTVSYTHLRAHET